MEASKKNKSRVIQSVQRAIDIIECFDKENKELSLHEISTNLDLNKSTTHGLINTLMINGYIHQDVKNGKYYLGKKLIMKALMVSEDRILRNAGEGFINHITEKYGVTGLLFLYKDKALISIKNTIPKESYYSLNSNTMLDTPLHATASGKLVLSNMPHEVLRKYIENNELYKFTSNTIVETESLLRELKNIKDQGYSIEKEEVELGIYSIAAPIYNEKNNLIGTISIIAPFFKIDGFLEEIINDIKNAGIEISKNLTIV